MTKGPNDLVLHCFGTLTQKRRLVFVTFLNWVKCTNALVGAISLRKCSIKMIVHLPQKQFFQLLLDNAPN